MCHAFISVKMTDDNGFRVFEPIYDFNCVLNAFLATIRVGCKIKISSSSNPPGLPAHLCYNHQFPTQALQNSKHSE